MSSLIWMFIATLCFSIAGAFLKKLSSIPTWEAVFFRSTINFLCLLPWIREFLRSNWKNELTPLLMRGLFGCISMFLYFYAIEHLKLADAAMLNFSSPLPTLVLSAYILKEHLTKATVGFVLLSVCGIALILKPDLSFQKEWLAGVSGLLSAFTAAVAYISIKQATRSIATHHIVLSFAFISAVVSFIPMTRSFVMPQSSDWWIILGFGLSATIAQLTMTRAYAELQVSVATSLSLMTVVFAAIWGWLFWQEIPDRFSILGALFIGIGLFGAYRYRSKA